MTDKDVYAAIVAVIQETGLFAKVKYGPCPVDGDPTAEDYPRVGLYPDRWINERTWEDQWERTVSFLVVLTTRIQDGRDATTELAVLARAVESAVCTAFAVGLSECLPAVSWIQGGSYMPVRPGRTGYDPNPGEHSIELRGQFAYFN